MSAAGASWRREADASAIIDGELCLPGASGVPDFVRLHLRIRRHRHELMVYAFDLQISGISARCRSSSAAGGCNGCWPGRACRACVWWRHMTTVSGCW
jgi:hypothetical protein